MVICLFGNLDICLHQCSIMHFFYIHPALFLFLYFLPEKHDTVNDEIKYKNAPFTNKAIFVHVFNEAQTYFNM